VLFQVFLVAVVVVVAALKKLDTRRIGAQD